MNQSMFERLFADAAASCPDQVTLPIPNNGHVHPRDTAKEGDGRAEFVIPLLAKTYGHVMAIGNTGTPLTTPRLAFEKRMQWQQLVPSGTELQVDVAGLLTESSKPEDIVNGYDKPKGTRAFDAMKMFMRSVSNAHGADVDNLDAVLDCIRTMANTRWKNRQPGPMRLMVHAERKYSTDGLRIPMFDREICSMGRDISHIFAQVPNAVVIVCHVSAASTIRMIRELRTQGYQIYGEISPQYSRYTMDDLFEDEKGGTAINAWRFCVPCFKTEEDRQAIEAAMVSGEPYFYLGSDDACHTDDPTKAAGVKINNRGIVVGGQTQLPDAVISYCIEVFAKHNALQHLPAFVSGISSALFDWPDTGKTVTYVRTPYVVEDEVSWVAGSLGLRTTHVAMRGETRQYQRLTS
jgi:dihydroorotase